MAEALHAAAAPLRPRGAPDVPYDAAAVMLFDDAAGTWGLWADGMARDRWSAPHGFIEGCQVWVIPGAGSVWHSRLVTPIPSPFPWLDAGGYRLLRRVFGRAARGRGVARAAWFNDALHGPAQVHLGDAARSVTLHDWAAAVRANPTLLDTAAAAMASLPCRQVLLEGEGGSVAATPSVVTHPSTCSALSPTASADPTDGGSEGLVTTLSAAPSPHSCLRARPEDALPSTPPREHGAAVSVPSRARLAMGQAQPRSTTPEDAQTSPPAAAHRLPSPLCQSPVAAAAPRVSWRRAASPATPLPRGAPAARVPCVGTPDAVVQPGRGRGARDDVCGLLSPCFGRYQASLARARGLGGEGGAAGGSAEGGPRETAPVSPVFTPDGAHTHFQASLAAARGTLCASPIAAPPGRRFYARAEVPDDDDLDVFRKSIENAREVWSP
eukprot:TRINITY_DN17910_c0_g1_i1.p1 TRINITY_DN17910_c0_g1~~TRINITY_DN17910_c0_g1_i1.p1  ORF type:complete len:496 (+),score=62.58 TRINITY_DN17910_c0_g1_i1:172-1488(+)